MRQQISSMMMIFLILALMLGSGLALENFTQIIEDELARRQ